MGASADADRAVAATPSSPQAVSPVPASIPSADDYGDFYDYEELPEGAEWCDRCQGLGTAECYCGGDQCYCENYGEMDCPRCHGEGYWVPTEAQKRARIEEAVWLRKVWAEQDTGVM